MRQNQFLNFLILSFSTRTKSVFQCRLTNGPPEEVAQNLGQLQVWPKICQRFIWISSVFDRKLFKAVFIMSSLWYFLLFQRLCICTNYIMFNCWPSKHAYIPRPLALFLLRYIASALVWLTTARYKRLITKPFNIWR